MNDGDVFQIELSNKTSQYLCLQFYWNNEAEANQLVLRPYQHVFIDRFIDAQSKITFKTYETLATQSETKDLGALKIIAYRGQFRKPEVYTPIPVWYSNKSSTNSVFSNILFHTGSAGPITSDINYANTLCSDYNIDYNMLSSTTYASTSKTTSNSHKIKLAKKSLNTVETGVVERGQRSSTELVQMDIINTYIKLAQIEYKILPMSQQRLYTSDELKVYCSNCGRRRRQKQNFCPVCGNKL